jgi:hypothetical protein
MLVSVADVGHGPSVGQLCGTERSFGGVQFKSARGGRITPGEWERCTGLRLRFIYRRRGPSLLVAEGRLNTMDRAVASRSKTGPGVVTAPIFLRVPQVKLPKRLNLAKDATRTHEAVPRRIVAGWVDGRLRFELPVSQGRCPCLKVLEKPS